MNAIDPRQAPRQAPQPAGHDAKAFLDLYESRKQTLPGETEVRDLASLVLRAAGLPRRSVEAWKYTDLRPLAGLALAAGRDVGQASRAPALLAALELAAAGLDGAARLVFMNGRFDASLSCLPAGIDIEIGPSFGALAHAERDAMVALNTMLAEDGARIRVPAGVDAGRLLLVMLASNGQTDAVSAHPRCTVLLEQGAGLSLLEIAHGEGLYVHNPVLEIEVRAGARLTHVLWQQDGAEALHFSTVYAAVDQAGSYDSFTLTLGGRLARHEVHARLRGQGGEVQVNAAQLLGGSQHADLTSVIAHDAPGCTSRQTVKNVLRERAHGVFQGKIVVARAGQKTDGYQMNQALLLSDTAEIDSKPELEIYADDVKCSHGATAGALDEDQLFYLRSRGVAADAARAILVRAFLDDALSLVDDEAVRGALERAVDRSWT